MEKVQTDIQGNNLLENFLSLNEVNKLIEIFNKEKIEIRFVGGCLRDVLLSKQIEDIDIAANSKPGNIIKLLLQNKIQYNDYALKYGSIIVKINNKKFEITSLRRDINHKGRKTDIEFTNDWKVDAERRDFTINSIYLSIDGKISDYFGGIKDLEESRVKFIGNIENRIEEDYLRIYRYYRFLGIFKKPNLIKGYEEILSKKLNKSFKYISNDVLRKEILKMFNTSFPQNSFFIDDLKKDRRLWLKSLKIHFLDTKYELGLNKCLNKIDLL